MSTQTNTAEATSFSREDRGTVTGASAPTADELAFDSIEDVKRVFALQQEHRWMLAQTTVRQRVQKLERLRSAILANKEAILDAVHHDFRKHRTETDMTEVLPTLQEIQHAIAHLDEWLEPRPVKTPLVLAGTRSEVRYEAKGVVLILGPWNYPFQLIVEPLVAAIASGNAVMIRPSEKVRHTSAILKRILRATFEEREVAIFAGDIDLADAMLDLPFDHIFFTGSTSVGQRVMMKAAQHLASVTLELGGKSPTIVDDTADLKAAAERIVWGKFVNAGQTCIAPDYVMVHEKVQDRFLEEVRAAVQRAYGPSEEARKATADLARIIDDRAFARLDRYLKDTVSMGARVEIGGQTDASQRYIAPTVLSGVSPTAPLMQEEIFGPILPVMAFRHIDEVLAVIRRMGKPLALYVFSRKDAHIEHVLRSTTSGGVTVNNALMHFTNLNLPFGGVGPSGVGSYHGEAGIRAFSHERAILRQGRPNGAKFFYPPYTGRTKKLLGLLSRLFS